MLPQYIVYISIITSCFAGYFYIRDTLLGKTKPNLASWSIWFVAPVVAAIIQFEKGAGVSALPVFMAGIIPFFVIISSFRNKNAYWKLKALDYICLILSLGALVSFFVFQTGVFATICAILADGIAFIPTYVKSWHAPDTETLSSYYSGSFNSLLSLLTLTTFSFVTMGFATYLFLGNLSEICLVKFRQHAVARKS